MEPDDVKLSIVSIDADDSATSSTSAMQLTGISTLAFDSAVLPSIVVNTSNVSV